MAETVLTYRGTVYPWQCDHMGHMNVMWYVAKFDEACWQLLAKLGISASRARQAGTGMAAVEQHIQYKREVYAGGVISIQSSMLAIKEKSVRMHHAMIDDENNELVALMEVVGVYLDLTTRKACPIPAELRDRAAAMVVA